jgi:succinate dehydrogenase/fumarate reductase flavoprotein subunit
MSAAIAAREVGASVLVVEMNYDIGGHAMVSGGSVAIGGGNSVQQAYGITDTADMVFADLTSPAASNVTQYGTKYVDRSLCRVFADNSVATFAWLLANGVQYTDTVVKNTAPSGGSSWVSGTARTNSPYWNGATTFPSSAAAPGGAGGTALMRPLEASARSIGVQFLLNYRMTGIIREEQYSGRVLGVTALATGGRFVPGSISPLQPFMSQGNISLENAMVSIRANRAVVVCTGGHSSNVLRRRECDPRLTAVYSGDGDPYSFQTGDGEYAARRVGAGLWGTGNQTAENDIEIDKPTYFGNAYPCAGVHWTPGSPIFPLVGAGGISVSNWADVIHVNMAGVRFVDESAASYAWIDPAMCINAASTGPEWGAGPIWMIFDSAAVTREGWVLGYPNTDPLFFFQANDIPTLAQEINTNSYQSTPMNATTLQATITRYNSLAAAGKDTDFGKSAIKYQINTPPYYAASASPAVHDNLSGLHITGQTQVMDLDGNVIPGLYAAGETAGGFAVHGLPKCLIFGRIAGMNAGQYYQG